jgi:hypothetical protein
MPKKDSRWDKIVHCGSLYAGSMDRMIEHLTIVESEIADLKDAKTKLLIYNKVRKQRVAKKLRDSIRKRIAWHLSEIRKAEELGFSATADIHPQTRSIAYPRHPNAQS